MINIDKIIEYIKSVKDTFLNDLDSLEINSCIEAIQNKRKNPKLYLAVIGEFSSGKSTFINALLGFRILKEAVMPTTACATYIECHARTLSVKVSFFDGKRFICTENHFSNISEYLYRIYSLKCTDLYQVISVLTSDQKVAQTVKSLNIGIPGNAIPKNIVIIDTPGFNPGSFSVRNHEEITKNVVENVADAAIILTSQEQAMSATLSQFLKTNIKRCLHRCIYVVTKFDTLEDITARKEVLDYVRQRISNDLLISNPRLFGLSAITMLPVKRIPIGKESEWPKFQKDFSNFMNQTWIELQKSRELVLSEHINILVKNLARICVAKLNCKQIDLQVDKEFLEAHKVETIQTVCDRMVVTASNAINETFSSLDYSFCSAEGRSKIFAEKTIDTDVMSLVNFETIMMPQIKSEVESEAKMVLNELNTIVNKRVGSCIRDQIAKMSKVFSSHYNQFPALKPTESSPEINLVSINNPDLNFSIAVSKIAALESKENEAVGGGAAGGGALGLLLGGPIGALVGASLGAIGGLMAGDQSNSMRCSAKPLVKNEISSFFASTKIKADNEILSIKLKYINLIKRFAQEHIKKYGTSVKRLIEEHMNKIDNLNKQIRSLRNAINGLQNIQDDIEHELAILKIK